MPDDMAYAITRAVFENFDDFRKLHPVLGDLTKERALHGTRCRCIRARRGISGKRGC